MSAKSHSSQKTILLGKELPELVELIAGAGFPAYRAKQLYYWMYKRGVSSFDDMNNIAKDFRAWLHTHCEIGHIEISEKREGADGSKKLLFKLHDGKIVEGVLMREKQRLILCVSSQVGCAVACTFCMTGFGGFRRQMTAGEIVSQILLAQHVVSPDEPLRNLVFMGMGEPMLNLDQVIPALRILTDNDGAAIAARRITVSTSGILPGIKTLGEADLGVNIAISLNASNNAVRNEIMPINKRYPIEDLLQTCWDFPLAKRRRITFEYVLLGGLNDSLENAKELSVLLKGSSCKINLIPWNPDPHLPFKRPTEETIRNFQEFLISRHFTVSIRYSKGVDIGAACGQLAGHWEAEQKAVPA